VVVDDLVVDGQATIELGHASDTTLSRSAAGVLAVEGVVIPSISSTSTLTNKTLTAPTVASADLTTALTLAGAAGTNGQVLTSAGSGLPSWTTPANGLAAATQAEMETATSNTVAATPLQTNFHPGVAKAWLKCDQNGNISVSHNITSITDTGTGVVTVTIGTDFSTANYVVTATVAPQERVIGVSITNSGVFVTDCRNSGSPVDSSTYFFTCFGDQA
jgi:hypothetical protein